ncbi:UDP-N-acetylmuramate--L-alanine ligase [Marinirhabdus gelatinilytica]|uniref:UDP-N-acetylmuramate--L-alanine ligase n=1 Tax=Marinirhabdus gelatinilytica TaxID=1703343 RepID=A0A370Q789_9FLAO|nr:cyanophycin synthetase [Marinirhabdus gelatinilytica]RDK84214.1 UDP-N-acetylmuramate--L-alanine ligase [Marinirhabdus gelatinilytica]
MSLLNNIQTIYFIGIGGIGMSALARFAKLKGFAVFGYDKTETNLTRALNSEGIGITFVDTVDEIPAHIQQKEETLVVYTPAIPRANSLLNWFRENNYTVIKRSQLLGEVTRNTLCLAVAGTHGKTTTSAILGHLLAYCEMPVTAFLGGIAENYNSNFISKGTQITVVEADEFDRSFLTLSPDIACVTSMDADHLDIYGTETSIQGAFREFADLLPEKNNLLFKKGLPLEGQSVAIEEAAAFEAQNVRIEDGAYIFDLKTPAETINNLQFHLPGHHNLHNAVTALGMAMLAGSPTHCLPKALATFKGVERRFSYKIKRDDLVLIDDYAHHPTEINALYQAVSEMYPEDEKVIVFQPHLFSRTKDFAKGFAQSLAQFDEVLLLDIYPAREEPIEGVTSNWLLKLVLECQAERGRSLVNTAKVITKSDIPSALKNSPCRIQLLVGAGDIGAEVEAMTKVLKR